MRCDLEVHEPAVFGTAGQSVSVGILRSFGADENVDLRADELLILFPRDAVLQGDKSLVAVLHDDLRHLIVHGCRWCARANRVLEGESCGEAGQLNDAEGLLEVLLGLTGEAHDNVCGDRRIRDLRAHTVENCEELLRPVAAAHCLEDAVGSGLQRHVQLRHDRGRIGHRLDHVIRECCRMRAGEADTLQAANLSRCAQEFAERLAVTELDAVGVHVLAEQGHLNGPVVGERLDLGKDVPGASILFLAAESRNDTKSTGVVAADRNGHPAAVSGLPTGRQRRGEHVEGFEDLELGLAVMPGTLEQCRKRAHVVGAENDIHPRRLFEDHVFVFLRETAADGNLHALVFLLDRGQVTEVAVELVVGVFAHGAGVDDHDICVPALGAHVPGRLEGSAEPLRVVHIHLAAERAYFVGTRPVVGLGKQWSAHGHDAPILTRRPAVTTVTVLPACTARTGPGSEARLAKLHAT